MAMSRFLRLAAIAGLAVGLSAPGPAGAQRRQAVDLELAFVVDASGSIDDDETRLQRKGYADALTDPRVLRAIRAGILQSVSVAYIEFAGPYCTRLAVPWTRIEGKQGAAAFGAKILALDRIYCPGGNAIGEAVELATASIGTNAFEGTRMVIDVSGDGPNTIEPPIGMVRDAAVRKGIVINALAIDRPSFPELAEYYKTYVTGGPGAFVIKARDRRTFAQAILRKLVREIASAPAPPRSPTRPPTGVSSLGGRVGVWAGAESR